MAEEIKPGCVRPTGGPVDEPSPADSESRSAQQVAKEEMHMIQVGKPAPDFVASGFHNGDFVQIKLSDFLGKWTLLCFYPGDFTFV